MAVYSLLAMGSFMYSYVPYLSLWKGFEVLAVTLVSTMVALMLKDESDVQHCLNLIYIALLYFVISALAGGIFNHSEAFSKMEIKGTMAFSLHGLYPFMNANTLSQVAAIMAAISLAWSVKVDRGYGILGPLVIFMISLACLILSHSRTSIVALLLVSFLVLFVFRRLMMLFTLFWVSVLLSLSGIIVNYLMPYFYRGQSREVFTTFSGRMAFWPEVMKKIWEAPIFGHGFYASQRVIWDISSVDNTYLEVLLGIGIMGLILICLPILSIIINLWKTRPWKTEFGLGSNFRFLWIQLAVIFLIVFIRSFTGPSFQNLHINLIIFTILIVCAHRLSMLKDPLSQSRQDIKTISMRSGIKTRAQG
jgi:O-antigen ligase